MIKLIYNEQEHEFIITGVTFPLRIKIKEAGFYWDPLHKKWYTTNLTADRLAKVKEIFTPEELMIDSSVKPVPSNRYNVIKERFPKLYDFQIEGVLYSEDKNILIADEMGLGKTISCITLCSLFNLPVIAVVPKSVLIQWKGELEKWINETPMIIKGPGTEENYFLKKWTLVGYEKLLRDNCGVGKEKEIILSSNIKYPERFILVCDEASKLKSYKTGIYKFMRLLSRKATKKIMLTGTPIENSLMDFYNIGKLIEPKFMDLMTFRNRYCIFREIRIKNKKYNPNNPVSSEYMKIQKLVGYQNLDEFVKKVASFCIRHKRQDVLEQLPELQEETRIIDLSPLQIKVYNKIIDTAVEVGREPFAILQLLRLVATDLRLFNESESKFVDELDLRGMTEKGEKLEELKLILDECSGKVLIFTQFARMAQLIHEEIEDSLLVVGGMPDGKRNDIIEQFKNEKRILISTDTLAYGMNLQFCPILIQYDLPWNPAVVQQRISRIYGRINGLSKSLVINMFTERIEDRIQEVLKQKQELFDNVIDGKVIEDEDLRRQIISKFLPGG